ncbi:alpha/beta hydrolase-fold protein [Streptomyces sp. H10-C2]|uniref:alpha/beta hydrolase n=1 Tax=unclassified Streptomyces TaxID=2593676 RepID=UPI0024B91D09|nr:MULTISPECIES: alpha/beta hydrolase-fold protein [unclassified Streptomyces]MDJ0341936.1 alpha/beta hydrolase-fold protein [Streptomyces sp. PH10-H1]MDJ0369909.1 alpha/beta hydrolase-fold protein [Streptomyces sp. H10-C2]MDJ0370090.1 alpha/beta hydrolase-fold protein [Streptomyces sp. H10-C2]
MSLTGTPFFLCTILFVLVALALPLAFWSRLRGPQAVRYAARFGMLLLCQVTSVLMVFVIVNNSNSLYDNWQDLLGTGTHVQATADLGPDGGAAQAKKEPKQEQKFKQAKGPNMDDVQQADLKGRISGVAGEVYVWLPPQYSDPAYKDKKFPVVEMLPGYPGSAKAWYGTLKVQTQLKPLMQSGQVAPFILISPRTLLLGGEDTGCANIPGKVNADTWLSVDVRQMVIDNFRVQDNAEGWAVAGYSAGAHCAMRMAVEHPDRYAAGVSLSGYNNPAAEKDSITGKDPVLREKANPLFMLEHAPQPPRISLFISGASGDGYQDGLALKKAAKAPTKVHVVLVPTGAGGHGTAVWKGQIPDVFRWLTQQGFKAT